MDLGDINGDLTLTEVVLYFNVWYGFYWMEQKNSDMLNVEQML